MPDTPQEPQDPDEPTNIIEATDRAISAAAHLTEMDAGAVEALRLLARKIAAWDQIVEWALEDAARDETRPAVPVNDNVSISVYIKTCDQLGLTPAGRTPLVAPKSPEKRKTGLASVSDIPRPTV